VASFEPTDWTHGKRRIHLLGVAGSGMVPLAEILMDVGHEVTGSDLKQLPERLVKRGLKFTRGHSAQGVGEAEVVVASAAIPK